MSREVVVVLRERDQFIAIDYASGGYPYMVDSPWKAEHWQSAALADSYRRKFPSQYKKWRIQLFQATMLRDLTPMESSDAQLQTKNETT